MQPALERLPDGILRTFAPAKINIGLRITGRRADGYHVIDSRFGFADAGDVLTARPAGALTLEIAGPFASKLDSAKNSVIEAAMALRSACGVTHGAALTLEKRLPVASGMGGGSADAAATLRLLPVLWDVEPENMPALAAPLGADVPACLASLPCHVSGIGEVLTPVPVPIRKPALLVNPLIPLPTRDVFDAYRAMELPFSPPLKPDALDYGNDLLIPALKLCPEIGDILAALQETGPEASGLSGSGATCYALFPAEAAAVAAAHRILKRNPGWWAATAILSV